MPETNSLSFDFGASSGRAILGRYDGQKIKLEEIYRFPNEPVRMGGRFYWDFPRLFYELKNGLKKASSMGVHISSIGIDTWGVDYGLLDRHGALLSNPIHYRDSRTDNIIDDIVKLVPYEEIYDITGIQYMQLNTLYQLYADMKYRPEMLRQADALLFIPDLFNYYLTDSKFNEYTIASTSQMMDARTKTWAVDLLRKINLPDDILGEIITPGRIYGSLSGRISEETGLPSIPVVAVGSHDTASAVAGTPFVGEDRIFISSGTWSLFGMECGSPIINEKSLKYNFTNEGGVCGTIRFLKNINGLWIIQQLRRSWSEHVDKVGFGDIINAAESARDKHFRIDPNDGCFMAPADMAEAIAEYCQKNGQGRPDGLGETAVAAYNGLAYEYKKVTGCLEEITGRSIGTINMIGGGIQDEYLCRLSADVTGKSIMAGPVEASAFGSIIIQLMAIGRVKDMAEGREIVRNSIALKQYIPNI